MNAHIKSVEEDTLSVYPPADHEHGFDMTSMMVGSVAGTDDDASPEAENEGGQADETDRRAPSAKTR